MGVIRGRGIPAAGLDTVALPLYHRFVSAQDPDSNDASIQGDPPADPAPPMLGLRHLALFVASERFAATLAFYREGMGMAIDWQPDPDNVYLSSGSDNFALHRAAPDATPSFERSPLDHLGFMTARAEDVEAWYARLSGRASELRIELLSKPRLHRDGATSFYLLDPAGHKLQIVHIPSVTGSLEG